MQTHRTVSARCVATGGALLAAVLALAIIGCASDKERVAEHLAKSEEFAQQGEIRSALIELRNALEIEPKNAEVNFRIAGLRRSQGETSDALFFFQETYRLDPDRVDAMMAEAALLVGRDNERAKEMIEDALERYPGRADVNLRQAELALFDADTTLALEAATRAIAIDHTNPNAHRVLGIVHEARIREKMLAGEKPGDELYASAVRSFKAAQSAIAMAEAARVYSIWEGHEEDAKAAYKQAIEWADGAAAMEIARSADRYALQVKDDEFRRWSIEAMLELDESAIPVWEELAAVSEASGGSAKEVMDRLVATRPDDTRAHTAYARFLSESGDPEAGFAYLKELADQGIEPARILTSLAALQIESRKLDLAAETVARLTRDHPSESGTKLSIGRLAIRQGRSEEAAQALKEYLDTEESAEAWSLLALAQTRSGEIAQATASINRAIELLDSPTPAMLRIKATVSLQSSDWVAVIRSLNQLSRATDGDITPSERVMFARAFYGLGRREAARTLLRSVLSKERPPAESALLFARQEAGQSRQMRKRAIGHLEAALEDYPNNRAILQELVTQYVIQKKAEKALALIERAFESGDVTPVLMQLRARALFAMGDYERAEQDALRSFEARPDLGGGMALLVGIYAAQDRVPEVIESFEQAKKAGVLPPDGDLLLARLYLNQGRTDEALAAYESVLATNPDSPGALNDLAFLLASRNQDLERALDLAQRAQQSLGENAKVADTLGFVYLRRGLHPAAIQQFQYAVELAEGEGAPLAEYYYHLGLAFRATGENASAVRHFEIALELDPEFREAEELKIELGTARAELEASEASS